MSELKTIIDANIKENGNQEITGKTLNYVLNKIAEGTQKDWNESDATNEEYIKGRTHGVTYEHVSVEGTLKELGYVPGEYVSVLHYARDNGVLEGKGLYLGGLLYNPIVGEEYRAKYEGPSVYARVVEVEDGYDVQIKGASDTGNLLKVAIVNYKTIDDAYISMDIARKSQVDALEDKVDNLPQGEEFDAEGNYPSLRVGTADTAIDLAGRGESVPALFGFRASGGKSIKDGRAYIKRIKGNSVVWNQLLPNSTDIVTSSGTKALNEGTRIVAGHKYLLFADFDGGTAYAGVNLYARVNGESKPIFSLGNNEGKTYKFVTAEIGGVSNGTNAAVEGNIWQYFYLVGTTESITNTRLIDLTQMFQAGNEPTTIEDFNARVATLGVDLYAYNEGEVIHCNTESIKSVGDNAFNKDRAIQGYVNDNTGEFMVGNYVTMVDFMECLPNTQYYFANVISYYYRACVHYYDADMKYIGFDGIGGSVTDYLISGTLTTPANARFMRVGTYVNATEPCMVTLVHSGWKQDTDAGYQEYWQDILHLPIISKYFPDGMKKAGTAHDEIRFNKATNKWEYSKGKIKSVDLGSLTWDYYSSSNTSLFKAQFADIKIGTSNDVANMLCAPYTANNANTWQGDKTIVVTPFSGIQVWIHDEAYKDNLEAFRAAMAGVILYYEAAEWEWVELDAEDQNFRDYYNVADFGTEQSQSAVPSAAFSADIIYQFNAVDMIREHEIEITELQKVIATMQAQLTSLINGVA